MPRGAILLVAVLGVLAAGPSCVRARELAGDAFLCVDARAPRATRAEPVPTFHSRVAVTAVDRFTLPFPSERYTLDLKKAEAFCWPVRLDGQEVPDPLSGLEAYDAKRTRRKPAPPPLPAASEAIETSLGTATVKIGGVEALQVPTLATGSVGGGIGPARDHYGCYDVRAERGGAERRGVLKVEVRSADAATLIEVRKPERLCVPANVRGDDPTAPKHPLDLLCYDARAPRGARVGSAEDGLVATRNGFGNELLRLGAAGLLCVPAARTDVVLPTPTPFPTLTPLPATIGPTPRPAGVRIEPTSATGLVRDRLCFSAVMDLPDGATVDITTAALWRIGDGNVFVPSGFVDGQKCFVGIAIGATTIAARDPGTGLTSPTGPLAAEWPIVALTVTPDQLGMRKGDDETLTVVAKLAGNRTRNVTQHVQYVSADPSIVRAANAAGNRSRLEGLMSGRTSVTITEALSSLTATAQVVVGSLQGIQVESASPLFPGEGTSLRATGVFDAGFTSNLTQDLSYESNDPAIAVATNTPGDRSRVLAVAPGNAVVTATDAASGLRSSCCGAVSVLADLVSLAVTPTRVDYRMGIGAPPLRFKARALYTIPSKPSVERNVSGRVVWSSTNPAVVSPEVVDGDGFERFSVLASGDTNVIATDLVSGVGASAIVAVFDRLDRLEVGTSATNPAELKERGIKVGQTTPSYVTHGYFDGGRRRLMTDVSYAVSDPTVAQWIGGGQIRGLKPGIVTVSAIDGPTGRSSADGGRSATLTVFGDAERLVLSPSTVDLDRGQARSLTAALLYGGGLTETVTQRVSYASSDPSVVEATNEPGNRSRIVARAGGTATISAFDLVTGLSSTTSGDDTVVTVHDDPLVSISIAPRTRRVAVASSQHFTATGHFESGATQNLTQRVEWIARDPAIAVAPNLSGDRSRIDAVSPGATEIAARDPDTGIVSTDSGDDAMLTVEALESLVLSPATLELAVGGAFSLTTVGTVTGESPVNVTQEAFYLSSDPSVVQATNAVGNKSRIEALAPGVATITAFRASAYPQATDSNAITVTVSPAE